MFLAPFQCAKVPVAALVGRQIERDEVVALIWLDLHISAVLNCLFPYSARERAEKGKVEGP